MTDFLMYACRTYLRSLPAVPHPLLLSCTLIYLKMMSNKWRVALFLSRKIKNDLREPIASNPLIIVRYSRMRSMPYILVPKNVIVLQRRLYADDSV